jgi:CheY-like chemotaxis protein
MNIDGVQKIILLVDDDTDDAEMFAEVLTNIDSTIRLYHVEDGLALFEHLANEKNEKPNVIFLDINMPEMNGWQCLSRLRGDLITKDIPVLIYTTSSHARDKQIAMDLGATAFITKPSEYKTLQKLLSAITLGLQSDIKSAINSL